ncbi:MAG: CoA-binding protein, partial [Myxococcota bacterium]|nr:CoA-binding protein [Myxococcota bacterium]
MHGRSGGGAPGLLESIFDARTIALVGTSPGSYWADKAIRNLALCRRPPRVFTVHPGLKRVAGLRCVRSLSQAPFPPDLVLILAPAAAAPEVVRQAARAGARAAIVVGDAGPSGDAGVPPAIEALRRAAVETGLVVLGPGSLGAMSPVSGAYPFVGRLLSAPPSGRIGIVSQSGAVAIEILRAPLDERLGLSRLLCVGSGASIGSAAAIEALVRDPETRAIGAHIEAVDDPARLAAA